MTSAYPPSSAPPTVSWAACYSAMNRNSTMLLLIAQVADRFADAGFNVCVMDPFHGNPWPMDKFPPKPGVCGVRGLLLLSSKQWHHWHVHACKDLGHWQVVLRRGCYTIDSSRPSSHERLASASFSLCSCCTLHAVHAQSTTSRAG